MGSTYGMSVIPLIFQCILVVGDPFMMNPNLQYQGPIVNTNIRPMGPLPENNQIRSLARNSEGVPQSNFNEGLLHTSSVGGEQRTVEEERSRDAKNLTLMELVDAFNDLSEHHDVTEEQRAVARDFEYAPFGYRPPSYGYRPPPYGYSPRPNYGPNAPLYYHEPAYPPPPPSHHSASKISLLKPALEIVKPVTAKVAGKVSGLIGLVLALLTGSSPDDLELKGFKDIVINGIVKPLLIAKGGIKSLISKLTIPVISLLLINLEVLITIWWLWEDCPQPHTPPPAYPYPSPYPRPNYNNYNTY